MLRQTLGQLRSRRGLFVMLLLIFVISGGAVVTAQDVTPVIVNDVAIVDRLSWGAIIAGAILGLVLQFGFNLLGISFGFAGMNPDRENSIGSELQDMTKETLIWMGVSMLVALFAAGWVAGRFAGVPNSTDGLLHGVLVWALVMLVSILLLMTSLGRIMSGMTHLIGRGFNLAGQVARTTAQGAATVAQAGVRGAANVAQATARTTENVAQAAADRVEDAARNVSNMPQTNGMQNRAKQTYDEIMAEAQQMLRETGLAPEQLEHELEMAKDQVQQGVQRVAERPDQAEAVLQETLTNIFKQGRAVASNVDRDKIVSLMTSRTNMSEAEARRTLNTWEDRFEQARQQIGQDAQRTRAEAEMKVDEIRDDIEDRVDMMRENVEETAIDVARQTSDTIAKFAGAIFGAMLVSGIAAALGGMLGAPI
jgi:hypothetical protein